MACKSSTLFINHAHDKKVDPVKSLVDRAATAGFGCIDVNIPKDISADPADELARDPHVTEADIQKQQSLFLAHYIWENYISVSDCRKVFFVGIGNAFQGIARLLSEIQEVHDVVGGVVAFIANNPLRPLSNDSWEVRSVSKWYAENSIVWVSPTHQVWKREKKLSKKFGNVKRSGNVVLGSMVKTHLEETWKWIDGRAREEGDTESEEGLKETVKVDMMGEREEKGAGDGDVEMDS